jgi:hypothetical protein
MALEVGPETTTGRAINRQLSNEHDDSTILLALL